MTNPTMTATRELGQCPACQKAFVAQVDMEVELKMPTPAEGAQTVPATVKLTGVYLSHDCRQKVTR